MEILANELRCPIFVMAEDPYTASDERPILAVQPRLMDVARTRDELSLDRCLACRKTCNELVPTYTGCRGRIVMAKSDFMCGRYCWECLTHDIEEQLLAQPVYYWCPSCHEPLPVWAIELCFPESELGK